MTKIKYKSENGRFGYLNNTHGKKYRTDKLFFSAPKEFVLVTKNFVEQKTITNSFVGPTNRFVGTANSTIRLAIIQ